jgi:hypothetical protein
LAATWGLRGVLALLILLWAYDGLSEPDLLLRGVLAVTVLAGIVLLVVVIQMSPGLQRVVFANLAGFVVFAGNVGYIALKSEGPLALLIVTLAAVLVAVPWVVRFAGGIRRLLAQEATAPLTVPETAVDPAEAAPPSVSVSVSVSGSAPASAEPKAAPAEQAGPRRERPRYTLPGQPAPASRRRRTGRKPATQKPTS